jgi:AbrB family looped-hinge helix DNA binding protein
MEVAKVTAKGQVTIPRNIRVKMDLKRGDSVVFFEDNGKYFLKNSIEITLKNFQDSMKDEAGLAGFNDPDDVVGYIKSRRKVRSD